MPVCYLQAQLVQLYHRVQCEQRYELVKKIDVELSDDAAQPVGNALLAQEADNAVPPEVSGHSAVEKDVQRYRHRNCGKRNEHARGHCPEYCIEPRSLRGNTYYDTDSGVCDTVHEGYPVGKAVDNISGNADYRAANRAVTESCERRSERIEPYREPEPFRYALSDDIQQYAHRKEDGYF